MKIKVRKIISIFLVISILFIINSSKSESLNQKLPISHSVYSDEHFSDINDPRLLEQLKNEIYAYTIDQLNSDEYFIEDISVMYLSKEYLEEHESNYAENIYFGYKLSDLDKMFNGKRYVFVSDDYGNISVKEIEILSNEFNYSEIIKNIAIGSGVILICVIASPISSAAGATHIASIFATSAKGAAVMASSSAAISALTSVAIKCTETGDVNELVHEALSSASESFKVGAVFGAFTGGIGQFSSLKSMTKSGLTMKEAAIIQKESKFPVDIIKQIHSMNEYKLYRDAGLQNKIIAGKNVLISEIDFNYTSTLPNGTKLTNLDRMSMGYSPIEPATGYPYELHHIGQKADGAFALLTNEQHRKFSSILHTSKKPSEIDRSLFAIERSNIMKGIAHLRKLLIEQK